MSQSRYFKRLKSECEKWSPHIKFKRLTLGFWRIYYGRAYLHEVYENMGLKGYDIEEENLRIRDRSYYQEYEDTIETIRNIKNYVEGYQDSIKRIKTRLWMHRHDKEFNEESTKAYETFVVK